MEKFDFVVAIPARYASTRLPGKALVMLERKTMIQHVYEKALASGASMVLVATDDTKIYSHAKSLGADVYMTSHSHESGTSRLAELVALSKLPDETLVVNLQVDEPLMPPKLIRQVAKALKDHPQAPMATLCAPLTELDGWQNPHIVKVVLDNNGYALYFSRAPIPYFRQEPTHIADVCYRHIGMYAYHAGFLRHYAELPTSFLEDVEMLEQLRILSAGYKIYVEEADIVPEPGIDTPDDVVRVTSRLQAVTNHY